MSPTSGTSTSGGSLIYELTDLSLQPTMPWISPYLYLEYSQMKVADLKDRLKCRGLSRTGNKAALVSRLAENDEAQ